MLWGSSQVLAFRKHQSWSESNLICLLHVECAHKLHADSQKKSEDTRINYGTLISGLATLPGHLHIENRCYDCHIAFMVHQTDQWCQQVDVYECKSVKYSVSDSLCCLNLLLQSVQNLRFDWFQLILLQTNSEIITDYTKIVNVISTVFTADPSQMIDCDTK